MSEDLLQEASKMPQDGPRSPQDDPRAAPKDGPKTAHITLRERSGNV